MKSVRQLFCICAVGLLSCSMASAQSLEKRFIGSWKGDFELTEKHYDGKEIPAPLKKDAVNATRMIIKADHSLVVSRVIDGKVAFSAKGTWEKVSTDEKKKIVVLKFIPSDEENGPPESKVTLTFKIFGDRIGMVVEPDVGGAIVFNRNNQSSDKKNSDKKDENDKSKEKPKEGVQDDAKKTDKR